jgi:hypothetical protein
MYFALTQVPGELARKVGKGCSWARASRRIFQCGNDTYGPMASSLAPTSQQWCCLIDLASRAPRHPPDLAVANRPLHENETAGPRVGFR